MTTATCSIDGIIPSMLSLGTNVVKENRKMRVNIATYQKVTSLDGVGLNQTNTAKRMGQNSKPVDKIVILDKAVKTAVH